MSNENKSAECSKNNQSVKGTKGTINKVKKQRKKIKNMKEHTVNNLANYVKQDVFSSNWKTFKQNAGNFEKNSERKVGVTKVENKRYRDYRKNKSADMPKSVSSATQNKDKCTTSDSKEITKVIAIDCEMVGIDTGKDNMLARVSLVNKFGNCIYDKYVLPSEPVVDYRTHVSGIRPKDLHQGERFDIVQKEVADILKDRILVGHAIRNDLKVLFLGHPRKSIRDTSRFRVFREVSKGSTPSLRKLSEELLGVKIQEGEHDSVVDARAAMQLYLMYRKEWEKSLHNKRKTTGKSP
ncbi:RNA exonuclease 4 [Periplaneta americana]|uniref:RNA exonuclease 4 n=1 Tax=Periplaneta americana TaxID=6978 RepID=UPI0037E7F4AE